MSGSLLRKRDYLKLLTFWKRSTEQASGKYRERLLRLPASDEGASRAQTKEIRVGFEPDASVIRFVMDSGAELSLTGRAISKDTSSAKSAARELCRIAYGNDHETIRMATMLQTRQDGKELVILRGATFRME